MNENLKAEDMSMVQACNTGVKAAVPYGAGDEQGEAAAVSAADILNSLFAPEDTVCLRVFSDKKCSAFHGQKLECKCRDYLKDMEPRLREQTRWDAECSSSSTPVGRRTTQSHVSTPSSSRWTTARLKSSGRR